MTSTRKRERGQGSIGHVPGSRFLYIWYYDNAGRQHRESTRSTLRSVAQEMLNQRLAAMGRGEKSPTEAHKVRYEDMRAILFNNYLEDKIALDKIETLPDGSVTLNHSGIKFLDEFFKGMRLSQIDTKVLRKYREARKERLHGKVIPDDTTINRDLALLRRMMNLAIEENDLRFAMPKFPMTSEAHNVRTGFVEPAKFEELLNAIPEDLQPYLLFYYETGCRPKATRQIIWDWVDLDEGMIYIPDNTTKNGEPLPVPISDRLVAMLRKKFRTGEVFTTTNFRKAFRKAADAVGLKSLIPYDLRRSAVRNLKRAGVDDKVAMKITGHKTLSVFHRYNIVNVKDVKDAMKQAVAHNASLMQVVQK